MLFYEKYFIVAINLCVRLTECNLVFNFGTLRYGSKYIGLRIFLIFALQFRRYSKIHKRIVDDCRICSLVEL